MLTIGESSIAGKILENSEKLGVKHKAEILDTKSIRGRWHGLYMTLTTPISKMDTIILRAKG